MSILIKGGRVIDPDTRLDAVRDLLVRGGKIAGIREHIESEEADEIIDAAGCFVMPGLIDMHVHLRDPGQTDKEDIASGTRAALRGGITTLVAMPNTTPPVDTPGLVRRVEEQAGRVSKVEVHQCGCITKKMAGTELSDIEGMAKAGILALSEDGKSVMDARLYRQAMVEAKRLDLVVLAHCEDKNLVGHGCVNADAGAAAAGLPGITNSTEDVIAARDILLAKETGARLHLCHCSTADSYYMLKQAKAAGVLVTGEVCPHHFTLCSEDIDYNDTNYKMNPPLRSRADMEMLRRGLHEDVFDVISTDHAPHTPADKSGGMEHAAFGIVGLESSVALVLTELVKPGVITPMQMAEKMSRNPARILGLAGKGTLARDSDADITVIDPNASYTIHASDFASKGRNTPFDGKAVTGRVRAVVIGGELAYGTADR